MHTNYQDLHQELLESGNFFEIFPTLSGIWINDKDLFPELWNDYNASRSDKAFEDIPVPTKHESKKELVSRDEISHQIRTDRKDIYTRLIIRRLLIDMDIYNLDCKSGYEITVNDIIQSFKSTDKG